MKKQIIDGENFIECNPKDGHNYIRLKGLLNSNEEVIEETIKISEMDDDEEIIITGKQLKQLQAFWGVENE